MSFPRYPAYAESEIEWVGEVPSHWEHARVRHLARLYAGGTPDKTNLRFWEEGTVPWLNSGAVNERVIKEPSALISEEALAKSSARWIPAGALVMALAGQGKTKGMVARLAIASTCNQSMAAIVPGPRVAAEFLFWWLDSQYQNIRNMAGGDLRDGLNLELVGEIPCPIPNLDEQHAIAAFLDYETAKIDALVAEQERLVELLKEKRQAVISHAVTKGLNPDAPMKDSGSDWIGRIPAHWQVRKLKHTAPRLAGRLIVQPHQYFADEGAPILFGNNIGRGELHLEDLRYINFDADRKFASCRVSSGDLLTVRVGDPGATVVVPPSLNGCHFASAMWIRQAPTFDSQWLCHVMNSPVVAAQIEAVNYGAAQEQFNIGDAANFVLPIPPLDEQRALVSSINDVVASFDDLATEARRASELLRERRAALISAAVTGQIDVRAAANRSAA